MRRNRLLVVLLAASVALAGCAGGGGSAGGEEGSPIEIVAASSSRTVAAGTSRMAIVATTTAEGNAVTVAADGVFDYRAQRGRLTMDLARLGVPGATGTAEILLLGPVFYMRFPALAAATGQAGKEWVRVDLRQAAQAGGVDPTGLAGVGSNDPSAFVALLRGAGDDLRRVGEESLRGEPTTHFRGSFDLQKALEAAPAAAKPALRKVVDQLAVDRIPMDVWIDGEGRLRKLVQTVRVGGGSAGSSTTSTTGPKASPSATVTVELFDFGVAVEVAEPPADRVADLSSVVGGQQQPG